MKIAITLIFLFALFVVKATTYHVATDGSGDYTTITQVNAASFSPGDFVLFNRGDIFRGALVIPSSGSSGNPIIFGAYGTGNKPIIMTSVNESTSGDWADQGGNIWINSDASFTIDVANLVFADGTCGIKKTSSGDVTSQGDFWYDFVNDRIEMYSVGNPATYYSDIECVLKENAISVSSKNYLTFENLDIRNSNFGISTVGTVSNIIVEYCDFAYIGGGDLYGDYGTRLGNGVEFYGQASDCKVRYCTFDNVYDAAVTAQGFGGVDFSNIVFAYNVISNSEYSFEYIQKVSGSTNGLYFVNNTCYNAGGGFGHGQRWDYDLGCHVRLSNNIGTMTDIVIKNNIFYNATEAGIIPYFENIESGDYDIDNNLYYVTTVASVYDSGFSLDDYTTLGAWQTYSVMDGNSASGDPLFTTEFTDLSLQAGSPAINAGVDVGLTTDYLGNSIVGLPDIGAYESGASPAVIVPIYDTRTGKIINGK